MRISRALALAPVLSLTVVGVGSLSTTAAHADDTTVTIPCPADYSNNSLIDFDGDGLADAVVAVPGADGGKGAIEVRYSRGSKTTTFAPGDGTVPAVSASGPPLTFAAFNANYDGCTDLAIGIPSYTVGGHSGAGAVLILFGSKDGFVTGPLITPNDAALPGSAQTGEHFGAALAGTQYNLTVGAPNWSPTVTGGHPTPHAGEAISLSIALYETPHVDSAFAIRKSFPHKNDRLGTEVAPNVAAAPTAKGHGHSNAGCIAWGNSSQSVATYCGHHNNDRLGASLALTYDAGTFLLYVGAPDHEVTVTVKRHGKTHSRQLRRAGVVEEFELSRGGNATIKVERIISQATKGVPGSPTAGNQFGYSVSAFDGHEPMLAVGMPGAGVKGHSDAGEILLRRGDKASSPWQVINRDLKGVAGTATRNDRFGTTVTLAGRGYPGAATDFTMYAGVPNDSVAGHVDAGRVQIFNGRGSKAVLTKSQFLTESGGAAAHRQYGFSVD